MQFLSCLGDQSVHIPFTQQEALAEFVAKLVEPLRQRPNQLGKFLPPLGKDVLPDLLVPAGTRPRPGAGTTARRIIHVARDVVILIEFCRAIPTFELFPARVVFPRHRRLLAAPQL